jgi:hypothetical protein
VRPVVQVRVREGVVAVEVEHAIVRAVVEDTAEGEQGRKHNEPPIFYFVVFQAVRLCGG